MLTLRPGVEEDAGQDGHGANGLKKPDAFAEKKEAKNRGKNGFAQLGGGDVGGGEPLQAPGEEGVAQQGAEHSQQQSHAHLPKTPAQHGGAGGGVQHQQDDETGEVRRKCTAQGYSDESAWARGQAWSIYGFTVAYRFTSDEKYLERAEKVAEYLFNEPNMPEDLVPYWDFDDPAIPDACRDASSASIIASALYELYYYTKNGLYKEKADKMIESLSSPAYRAAPGTNGGFILMHSVGSIPHGSNIDVPLNYADYYFLEALIRKGKIEKGEAPVTK